MQTACFKDHGAVLQNPPAQMSPIPFVPWWTTIGSQHVYGESPGQIKTSTVDHPRGEDQLTVAPPRGPTLIILEKEDADMAKFSVFTGHRKDIEKGQKAQQLPISNFLQSFSPKHQAHIELGLGQPRVSTNYPYIDQNYSLYAVYGAQVMHGQMRMPLNVTKDGPIYVNAKQYHGILRRRQSRAKAVLANKLIKARKPYLHESRHLHAMRRARGCGGRFLNTKKVNGVKSQLDNDKVNYGHLTRSVHSLNSEVLQSGSRNVSSGKDGSGGSSLSGSEVTSTYSQGDLGNYQIEHRCPSFHPFSDMVDGGQSINNSNKWVPTANSCCDFLKV